MATKERYVLKSVKSSVSGNCRKGIINITGDVRKKLRLEADEPINDICGLMESAGIKIHLVKADLKDFYGLSVLEDNGGPAICVNVREDINVERQIFTVAHELGHLLLHSSSFDVSDAKEREEEEKEADIFASYFLMPEEAFRKAWEENKGLHWFDNILHMKRIFKVSYKVVLYRLCEQGVSQSIWKKCRVIINDKYGSNLKTHFEPAALDQIDFIEDRLKRLVREALEKEEITVSRAAEILNMRITEMRDLINAWAMVQ